MFIVASILTYNAVFEKTLHYNATWSWSSDSETLPDASEERHLIHFDITITMATNVPNTGLD